MQNHVQQGESDQMTDGLPEQLLSVYTNKFRTVLPGTYLRSTNGKTHTNRGQNTCRQTTRRQVGELGALLNYWAIRN